MAIARFPGFIIDCPDPASLATFYAALLDWTIEVREEGAWAEARSADGQLICFQQVDDYRAPAWPGQDVPQQMHLDVIVDDLDIAEAQCVAIGATVHAVQPGTGFRVLLDPAGHPFCLCIS